ncbi:SDR family oxidoreductase [Ravibacter arvi]|uniref:SDR family oxidoreductase n=1 Tax=Ravibacter arvi TaxID=2051041 RepID=A0ABP8LXH5_9BACT
MKKSKEKTPEAFPPQSQARQPGITSEMVPTPDTEPRSYPQGKKLHEKVAIITGGDSGIGKAVALLFAEEGAKLVIVYYDEHADAEQTEKEIRARGSDVLLISGDLTREAFSTEIVDKTLEKFGKIDILVNNAAVQFPQASITDITSEQLKLTFSVNFFAPFYLTRAALPHMKPGANIINTSSITAFRGSDRLIDYSATKGALISFTRSLSSSLAEKGIRVNAVAPGPIWTPLIPASFDPAEVAEFGTDVPMGRAGQPMEVATAFLFLASGDGAYFTGQTLHPNGGVVVNT